MDIKSAVSQAHPLRARLLAAIRRVVLLTKEDERKLVEELLRCIPELQP